MDEQEKLRQGDVLLVLKSELPSDAKAIKRAGDVILAEGEATGHAHRVVSRHAKLYRTEEDQRFMRGTAGVQLGHEEHKTRCHACPEFPVSLATHYDATMEQSIARDAEARRYACSGHASTESLRLEEPGKTYIRPGVYDRVIDADYVPGELPRNVAD